MDCGVVIIGFQVSEYAIKSHLADLSWTFPNDFGFFIATCMNVMCSWKVDKLMTYIGSITTAISSGQMQKT